MTSIRLQNVSKHFGRTVAVDRVSLEIASGELFFLLGPSGCGKTTLLRMLAGLCDVTEGAVHFDGRDVTRVPPQHRNTGMVFQSYALWPHMTVAGNVAYGLEVRRVDRAERTRRVGRALELVGMSAYAERRPAELSGGQQQRVAVARALVVEPAVLLLDEPLSNLDAKLRTEMREEIRRIHHETGITTVYVTHDQDEALSLADRLVVLDNGRVQQVGSPMDVYHRPATTFVAEFIGEANLVAGEVAGAESADAARVRTGAGEWTAPAGGRGWSAGQRVVCSIRPEAIRLGAGDANTFSAKLVRQVFVGGVHHLRLAAGESGEVALNMKMLDAPGVPTEPGAGVTVHVPAESVRLLPVEDPS